MIDDSTDRQIVRKSYELITAKNSWNEIESKLLATFIKELNPKSEDDFREMIISVDSIQKLWGIQINTTRLRDLCFWLKRKTYEIPTYDDKGKITKYSYVGLFSRIDYLIDERCIKFKFDDMMKPHLLTFTRFIKYKIENILQFESSYSLSFYEYFKSHMFKKEKIKTVVIELDYMRTWLMLEKKYPKYANIKQKILKTVQEDLQKHSDIYFTFKEIKKGRTVHAVEFNITENLSKQQRAELFGEDDFDSSYDKYIGKSCFYNQRYFLNIVSIIPYDDFIKVNFEDESSIKFKNIKDIDKIIVQD